MRGGTCTWADGHHHRSTRHRGVHHVPSKTRRQTTGPTHSTERPDAIYSATPRRSPIDRRALFCSPCLSRVTTQVLRWRQDQNCLYPLTIIPPEVTEVPGDEMRRTGCNGSQKNKAIFGRNLDSRRSDRIPWPRCNHLYSVEKLFQSDTLLRAVEVPSGFLDRVCGCQQYGI
jgi:hypothetical protein